MTLTETDLALVAAVAACVAWREFRDRGHLKWPLAVALAVVMLTAYAVTGVT